MVKIKFNNSENLQPFYEALDICLKKEKNEHLALFVVFLEFTDLKEKGKLKIIIPDDFKNKSLNERTLFLEKEIGFMSAEVFWSVKKS